MACQLPLESYVGHLRSLSIVHGILEQSLESSSDDRVASVWKDDMRKLPLLQYDLGFFEPRIVADVKDAVDAAIATSFALGVVEPWMSGPAAGGAMVLWRAKDAKARVINFGCRSPRELNPADYPLSGSGKSSDLFPWPSVVDDRNVMGATAVAVPGVVAGIQHRPSHRQAGFLNQCFQTPHQRRIDQTQALGQTGEIGRAHV